MRWKSGEKAEAARAGLAGVAAGRAVSVLPESLLGERTGEPGTSSWECCVPKGIRGPSGGVCLLH